MKSWYTFLLAITSVCAHAAADCPDLSAVDVSEDSVMEFDVLRLGGTLGDTACATPLCDSIAEWERKAPGDEKTTRSAELLDAIRASAAELPSDRPGVSTLNNQLDVWRELLSEADIMTLSTAVWQVDPFRIFGDQEYEIDIQEIFAESCDTSVSSCNDIFETTACVYSHAVMQRRVYVGLLKINRQATIQYLERLNSRWSAFNSGGRSLFPWELWANGAIQAGKGAHRGFVEPPTYQISLLHPSVAVQGEDTSDGSLQAAVVLELIGWYGWRWGGRDGAAMKRPFGGSLILSWDGSDEVGYGAMIHLPKNWSIGATQKKVNGNTETTLLLSVDLGKFLTEEERLRQNLIDKIEPALTF